MVQLQVLRLAIEGKETISSARVDKICTQLLGVLHNAGLDFIVDFSQTTLPADNLVVNRTNDIVKIFTKPLFEEYSHRTIPYLFFTTHQAQLAIECTDESYITDGYGEAGVAFVRTDILDCDLEQGGNDYFRALHEIGHAVYDLNHHMDAYWKCVMGGGAKSFCSNCIEKAKSIEKILASALSRKAYK